MVYKTHVMPNEVLFIKTAEPKKKYSLFCPFLDFPTIQIAKKPATKEPAADEAVEEVAEVVGGEEAVVAPLVVGFAMVLAPEAPAVPEEVNGIGLGVALGPVALRPTV